MVGNDVVDLAAARPHACEKLLRGLGAVDGGNPSEWLRALAIGALARHFDTAPGGLSIRRIGRMPHLFLRGSAAACPLWLAHHGRFAAGACAPSPHVAHRAATALEGAA